MKEIKAYIRPTRLERTIRALEDAGATDMTIIRVDALCGMADFEMDRWHILRKYQETYSAVAKIELVCRDEEAQTFMHVIKENCHTGEKGDGRIFLSPIEYAINIKTGEEGESAVCKCQLKQI